MMRPRQIVRALRALEHTQHLLEIVACQQTAIDMLEQEKIEVELGLTRIGRDLIGQFIVALDMPENHDDLRETLHEALIDFKDQVARLEERTC